MQMKSALRPAGSLVVFLLVGCLDTGSGQVSGTVELDGKPVEAGSIQFVPADGKTATSGGPISGGKYSVRVAVGAMKVSISAPKVVGKKKIYPTANSPEMPVTAEALPAKYNDKTELQLEVRSGSNAKNWDLKSK